MSVDKQASRLHIRFMNSTNLPASTLRNLNRYLARLAECDAAVARAMATVAARK
jgi:hypothetical protein